MLEIAVYDDWIPTSASEFRSIYTVTSDPHVLAGRRPTWDHKSLIPNFAILTTHAIPVLLFAVLPTWSFIHSRQKRQRRGFPIVATSKQTIPT